MIRVICIGEDATVALVPEIVVEAVARDMRIPATNDVSSLLTDELPHVGSDIPATKSMQAPVGLDGRDLTVMIVVVVIGAASKVTRKCRAHYDASHVVWVTASIAVCLPGYIDKSPFVEVRVCEKSLHEATSPGTRRSNVGVMPIVVQIWGDEAPLR